jgi:hypothetical protein
LDEKQWREREQRRGDDPATAVEQLRDERVRQERDPSRDCGQRESGASEQLPHGEHRRRNGRVLRVQPTVRALDEEPRPEHLGDWWLEKQLPV